MIVVGADVHKRTHTFVAIDQVGHNLGAKTVKATTEGHATAVMWAREQFGTELLWGIEDCRNMSARLEQDLLGAGQQVVRVGTKLMAQVRKSARTRGKSDPIDAEAVARAVLREPDLPVASHDEVSRELKLLTDRRDVLVVQRTSPINRLRWHVLTPVALGLGAASLVIGLWLLAASRTRSTPRPYTTAEQVGLMVAAAAIVLALFWLTGIYATFRGEDDAKTTAGQLWSRETSVVLDTKERLSAPSNLIKETRLSPQDPAKEPTLFRYECFRTLVVRGDRWVLVPAGWTNEYGYAVIITADSSNRISLTKLLGIAKTRAANWNGGSQCPEVAPM